MFSILRTAETKNDDGTPLSSLFEHVLWKIRHPKDPFLHPKQSHQFDTLWHQTQDGYLAPIYSVSPKSSPVGSIMVLCGPYTHPLVYLLNKSGFLHQLLNSGLRVHLVSHRGHNLGTGQVRSSFENVIHYDIPSALDAIHRFDHDLPLFLLGVDLGSILAMGWLSICGKEDFCGAAIINTPVAPPKGPVPNILQQLPSWICPPIEQLGFIAANLDLELSLSTLSPSLRRRILHDGLCSAPIGFAQQIQSWRTHPLPRLFGTSIRDVSPAIKIPTLFIQPEQTLSELKQNILIPTAVFHASSIIDGPLSVHDWDDNGYDKFQSFVSMQLSTPID